MNWLYNFINTHGEAALRKLLSFLLWAEKNHFWLKAMAVVFFLGLITITLIFCYKVTRLVVKAHREEREVLQRLRVQVGELQGYYKGLADRIVELGTNFDEYSTPVFKKINEKIETLQVDVRLLEEKSDILFTVTDLLKKQTDILEGLNSAKGNSPSTAENTGTSPS